jgi:hypothetical protein
MNGCFVSVITSSTSGSAFEAIRDYGSTVCRQSYFSSFRSKMSSPRAASLTIRPSLKLLTSRDHLSRSEVSVE